jgi:VIT1/CCC1 family predicted Fe2+/Mn2+ transporter
MKSEKSLENTSVLSALFAPVSKSERSLVIQGPVVQVQGSLDRATAEYAAKLVQEKLKNVIVEPTTTLAASTHKRIRNGAVF